MSKYTAVNVGAVGDGAVSFNVIGVPPQTQGARPYTADQDKWLWNRAMAVAHAAWCKSLSARKSRDKWAVVKALRDTYSFQRTTFVLNWWRATRSGARTACRSSASSRSTPSAG